MAAYAKTALRSEMRKILREPNERNFSNTELEAWIDEGARRASAITLCHENVISVSMTAAYADLMVFELSSEPIKIDYVTFDKNASGIPVGLQRLDFINFGHGEAGVGTADVPKYWTHFEDSIIVFPAASSTYANGATPSDLDVYGYWVVDDYGGKGSETLPNELQHSCMDYALACAYTKVGKHSLSALHMQKFLNNCIIHRRDVYDAIGQPDSFDRTRIPDVSVQVGGEQG